MITLCLSTICLVLVLLLIRRIHWAATYWKKLGVPHESYISYLRCFLIGQTGRDIFDMMEEYTAKYGHVYGTYSGFTPALRVSSVEGVKDALVRRFPEIHSRSIEVQMGSKLWDNNILAVDYPKWKLLRTLTSNVLTGSKLKVMKNRMEGVAKRLVSKLEKLADNKTKVDANLYAKGTMMEVIAAVTFSLELDALEDPNNPFIEHCSGIFNHNFAVTLLFSFPQLIKYLPTVEMPKPNTSKFFTNFSKTLLQQRRQKNDSQGASDALDAWLETQKSHPELTDDMLISQMFIFFFAGFETSAYTLMFTLQLLATHPKVQEKVYQEIIKIAPDPDNVSLEEYSKMKLLEACLHETLRIYPTDFVLDRITVKPCTVADIDLDKGIVVQVPTSSVNMDPNRFPDPEKYMPERFVDGTNDTQDYLTFGQGPKNCVGQRLALVQLTVILSAVLRKLKIEPLNDDYDPSREYQPKIVREPGQQFLPFPINPIFVKFVRRD